MRSLVERAIFLLAAVFPFGLAATFAVLVFFGGAGQFFGHDLNYYSLSSMGGWHLACGVLVFGGWLVGLWWVARRLMRSSLSEGRLCLVFFLLAVGLRLILPLLFCGKFGPWSDFAQAWNRALGNPLALDYHKYNPAWMNFALFLKGIAEVFGPHFMANILSGVLFDGVTVVGLYLSLRDVTGNRSAGILAACLYAFNPSSVAYAMTGTPEHASIAFFSLATWLLIRAFGARDLKAFAVLCALTGLAAGLGNSFKPFFYVFGLAAALVFPSSLVRHGIRGWSATVRCMAFLLVYLLEFVICGGFTCASERAFDENLHKGHIMAHYLCVGLNPDGEGTLDGQGSDSLSRRWVWLVENGCPPAEAEKRVANELAEAWAGRWDEVPTFLFRKTIWSWQDDNRPIQFLKCRMRLKKMLKHDVRRHVLHAVSAVGPVVGQIWYLGMMAMGAMAAVLLSRKKDCGLSFLALLLLGFFAMILLAEGQSRYKCLVLPAACGIVAAGLLESSARRAFCAQSAPPSLNE